MTTYIALLRGVNVGGHKMVAMATLRELMTGLGFDDVRTLLQSGNVVFRDGGRAGAEIERLLEAECAARLGLRSAFHVRSAAEWAAVVAGNPFRAEAERDPGHLLVHVLKEAPDARRVAALRAAIDGPELVATDGAGGRHAYLFYPAGAGRSRLTSAVLDRALGAGGTGRNWNTVLKLADASAARRLGRR